MSIFDFLDLLEERRLVSSSVVSRLREKASQDASLSPGAVLKFLVKKELIARSDAEQLLQSTLTVTPAAESSIMGNVSLPRVTKPSESNLELVTDDEDIPTLDPIDSRQNLRLEQLDDQEGGTSSIFEDSQAAPEFSSGRLSALASFSSKAREESAVEELLSESRIPIQKKATKTKGKRKRSNNQWDSSLILYGGGGLMLLMLGGAVIYYLLNRENADVVLQEATGYFENGSYPQAIEKYEKFVDTFKSHPQYSAANVRLGLAKLWRDTEGTNFEQALQTSHQVLDDIEDEPDFRSAQRDLSSLIPKIAKGLATKAEESTDPESSKKLVDETREALALSLNTKYIPKEFRDEVLLSEVEETLVRVERNREQSADLGKTLGAIQEALDKHDISAAYKLRRELLERYPALIKNETLATKVAEITVAEAQAVKFSSTTRKAERGERPSLLVASLTLAEHVSDAAATAEGQVAVHVGGSLYGLRANDGTLLWQRYVGANFQAEAVALSNGDFLYVDAVHHELVRVEGPTGKSIWRLALEGECLQPILADDTAYVAQVAGKVLIVDLAGGELQGMLEFGQQLAAPPTIDSSAKRLYVLGEQSSLYTISTEDHSCLGVYYLGQNAGNVAIPLVKVLNKLIVPLNTGSASSQLVVLTTDEKGVPSVRDLEERMVGTINTPLLLEARRLVAVTTAGQIAVFEVMNASGKGALSSVAVREAERGSPLARFALLQDANIWIGDNQISKLTIQATGKNIRLSNLENDFAGDSFNAPLQWVGDVLIHVRRPIAQAGSIVAATKVDSGQTAWQTELGVPVAGPPTVDPVGGQITAITASGAAYQLDRQALSRRIQDKADRLTASRRSMPNLTQSVSLGQGRIAASEVGTPSILHYRPGAPRGPLELLKLPAELTSQLVAWREGFIAPTKVGQVYYLSAEDGQQLATPFQPPLEANQEIPWVAPAVYSDAKDSQFVLSDGTKRIYLINLVTDPQPHLEAVAERDLGSTVLNTQLAVSGDVAAGGTDSDTLSLFKLPSLEPVASAPIEGQITWGPFAVGDGFLMATSSNALVRVSKDGNVVWTTPLEGQQPVGTPLVDGGDVFVAWQLHGVSRIGLSDGTVGAKTEVEEGLVSGPVAFATRLVLATADGTLLVINRP